jgi:Sulfatase
MKKIHVFHPLLFALYPILFLYSHNVGEVSADKILLPAILSLSVSVIIFTGVNFILKDKFKAGLATTLFIVIFFSYGHLLEYLEARDVFLPDFRHKQLIPGAILVWGYSVYFIRTMHRNLSSITTFMNVTAIILILINGGDIAIHETRKALTKSSMAKASGLTPVNSLLNNRNKDFPDIYYILLDEYANLETMRRIYGSEDTKFINYLHSKGFYIASKSKSKFSSTWPSLASSLNMEYVDAKMPPKDLYEQILNSRTAKYLKSRGYKYIYISNQLLYDGTASNPYADMDYPNLSHGQKTMAGFDPFQLIVIKTSMLRFYYSRMLADGFETRKGELLKIDLLKRATEIDGPKFVFSHHLITHMPFLFGPTGELIERKNHRNWEDKTFYLGAHLYADSVVMSIVDNILNHSKRKTIIIIQSDHGPRGGAGELNPKSLDMGREWENIFNAYYFPDGDPAKRYLYDSIPYIDTFRLIFNAEFGEHWKLSGVRMGSN